MKKLIYQIKIKLLILIIIILLFVNKVLIQVVPFRIILRLYSNQNKYEINKCENCECANDNRIILIAKVMRRTLKIIPFDMKCFEQSLTVLALGNIFNYSSVVYFGITKDNEGKIKAHAWSRLEQHFITGFENKDEYNIVYQMAYIPKKTDDKEIML